MPPPPPLLQLLQQQPPLLAFVLVLTTASTMVPVPVPVLPECLRTGATARHPTVLLELPSGLQSPNRCRRQCPTRCVVRCDVLTMELTMELTLPTDARNLNGREQSDVQTSLPVLLPIVLLEGPSHHRWTTRKCPSRNTQVER